MRYLLVGLALLMTGEVSVRSGLLLIRILHAVVPYLS